MKILVFKSNEKEQDAVQQYVLEKAVIEVFDDIEELKTVINSSVNDRLALVIPDAEIDALDDWKNKVKNEYPQVTLIALDPGISWQTSMKSFLEAPDDIPTRTATELDLDETVNTENIEFVKGENFEPEVDEAELKFEASSALDLSETSPTVLQLDDQHELVEDTDEPEGDLSDNGLEFDEVDDDKTQVISLTELNENLAANNDEGPVDLSDNGLDLGDDSLSGDLGFLSDDELNAEDNDQEVVASDSGGINFGDTDDIAGISLADNNDLSIEEDEPEEDEESSDIDTAGLSLDDSETGVTELSLGSIEDEEAIDEDVIDISTDDLGIDDSNDELSLSDESLDDVEDELLSLDEETESEIEELSMLSDDDVDEAGDDDADEEELLSFPDSKDEDLIQDTEIKDIALTTMDESEEEDDQDFSEMTLGGNALGQNLLSDDQLQEVIEPEQDEPGTSSRLSFDTLDEHEDDEIDENDFSIKDVEAVLGEESEEIESELDQALEMIEDEPEEESQDMAEESVEQKAEVDSEKLEEFSETIRELREDRERLLSQIEEFEISKEQTKREHLTIEAQLDEKKIEINLAKKRFAEEYERLNSKINELKGREHEGLDKNKELHAKIEQLNKKAYLDLRKIQLREKELENQLGLLKTDTENQVRNRDIIILDLKRKIDVLEFDIEQAWKQEKAAKREKLILQSKIDRLVASLKEVVEALHGDDIKQWLDKVHDDEDKS